MSGRRTKFWACSSCLILLLGASIAGQQPGVRANGPGTPGQATPGARGHEAEVSDKTSILVLGIGTPAMNAERSGTSIGVIVRGVVYFFDAGPGIERRMFEARGRANNGILRGYASGGCRRGCL